MGNHLILHSTRRVMAQSLKGNIAYTTANTFLGMVFPLITFPYISRVLQPEGVGLYNFYYSILAYVGMFANLGITLYATRLIARHRDDVYERSKLTIEVFLLHCLTTLIACSSVFVLAFAVPRIYEHQLLFFVMAVSVLLGPLYVNWFYQAIEEFKYITIRSLAIKLVSLVLLLTLVKTPNDVMVYAILSVLATISHNFFNIIYLRKFISLDGLNWHQLQVIRHLKPCLMLFLLQIVMSIYLYLDSVMLGFLQSDIAVGYYSIPLRLSHITISVIGSLGTALLPRFSYLLESGNKSEFYALSLKSVQFTIGITLPIAMGFILLATPLIHCVFGETYAPSILVLQLISPSILFAAITNLIGIQILYPQGKERLVIYSTLVAAIVNVGLNWLLIPIYSYNGAAITTCIAELIVLALQLYWGRRYLPQGLFTSNVLSFVGATLFMGVLVWSITQMVTLGWLQLLISMTIGVCSYFMLLLGLKNEPAFSLLSTLKHALKRGK